MTHPTHPALADLAVAEQCQYVCPANLVADLCGHLRMTLLHNTRLQRIATAAQAEKARLQEQITGHCERIAAQSRLLGQNARKYSCAGTAIDMFVAGRGWKPLEIGETMQVTADDGRRFQITRLPQFPEEQS